MKKIKINTSALQMKSLIKLLQVCETLQKLLIKYKSSWRSDNIRVGVLIR